MSFVPEPTGRRLAVLRLILEKHLTSRSRLDLLVFWGRYPGGWFDRAAIKPFTRASRREVEQALEELVAEGVIRCQRDGHVSYYALTEDVEVRGAVQELPRLTPNERRYLLHLSAHQREGSREEHTDKPPPRVLPQIAEGAES